MSAYMEKNTRTKQKKLSIYANLGTGNTYKYIDVKPTNYVRIRKMCAEECRPYRGIHIARPCGTNVTILHSKIIIKEET